jgi:hypothetical protein
VKVAKRLQNSYSWDFFINLYKNWRGPILHPTFCTSFTHTKKAILALRTYFGNIDWHDKMHLCTKYGDIIINYVMDIAKTLATYLESMDIPT